MKKPAGGATAGRRSTGHRSKHTAAGKKKNQPYTAKQFKHYIQTHRAQYRRQNKTRGFALDGITEETVEFGRSKPYTREEAPRLVLEHYLDTSALLPPSPVVDYASQVASWPMYGNDRIGDCTCAAAGHMIQAWTDYATTEVTIGESDVIQAYSAITGYNPATGAGDNGANEQDVLNYWRKTGIGGHKIGGFAELASLDNLTLAKQCLEVFGTIYLGINVPQSAMDQFRAGEPWAWTGDTNIIGGHAVPVQYWGTHETGEIEVVTWGKRQRMTRRFWLNYVEEAWVVFSPDWLEANGQSAGGDDLSQLRAAFTELTGNAPAF